MSTIRKWYRDIPWHKDWLAEYTHIPWGHLISISVRPAESIQRYGQPLYPQYGSSSSSSSDSSPLNGVSIRCNDENGYARNVGEYWVSKFGKLDILLGKVGMEERIWFKRYQFMKAIK